MLNQVRYVPGAIDARIQQPFNYPNMTVNVDRTRAARHWTDAAERGAKPAGGAERQLSDQPSFYLDPRNGVTYNVAVQAPQYRLDSMAELKSLPVTGRDQYCKPVLATQHRARRGGMLQLLRRSAPRPRPERPAGAGAGQPGHHCARRRTGHGEPLRHRAGHRYLRQRGGDRPGHRDPRHGEDRREHQKDLPRGSHFILRGQSETMYKSYFGLLAAWRFPFCWSTCSSWSISSRGSIHFSSSPRCRPRWPGSSGSCSSPTRGSACRRSPAPSCAWAWPRPTPSWW